MRAGRHTVWAPGILRYVFMVLRHVPAPDLAPPPARLTPASGRVRRQLGVGDGSSLGGRG